jgi:pullulanase/glycogen debranching enzyme
MVDLLHLYGIAVVCDVVYNHGGGFGGFGGIQEKLARRFSIDA